MDKIKDRLRRVGTGCASVLLAVCMLLSCSAYSFRTQDTSEGEEDVTVDEDARRLISDRTLSRDSSSGVSSGSGTWTILVYLCGSDLETESGLATGDLMEMLESAADGDVTFVVETGGSRRWQNSMVSASVNGRFVITGGEIYDVEDAPRANMGESGTLTDFLVWGVRNYPADNMGLVFWDHGGGSISGVCFDERNGYDSLSLREIDAALLNVYPYLEEKFEFIGFDACLMGTVETANMLSYYADYMYASEEYIPGSGWDYDAIGDYLAQNPGADGRALGEVVCDSYYSDCRRYGVSGDATMSVIDLSLLDELVEQFDSFAENMYRESEDAEILSYMVRGIAAAENFGGNNPAEGYTNMVDLGGLISACSGWADGAEAALAALDSAVVYSVSGANHRSASGLSIYYPLSVQGSAELTVFGNICVSRYYLSFVDRQSYGSVNGGETDDYSDDYWFEEGYDEWQNNYTYDEDSGYFDYEEETDDYWEYIDDFEQTGESALITFESEPQLDDDGLYWFALDESGLLNTADVTAFVFEWSDDEEDLILIGNTCDVYSDWDEGWFCDEFDGYWLSLPDGQNLCLYIVEAAADYTLYTAPILLNDELVFLRIRQEGDYSVSVEGVWDGIGENGVSARYLRQLERGDVIIPVYDSFALSSDEEGNYIGWEYTVTRTLEIEYALMEEGTYFYAFCIDDLYGDYLVTDFVVFTVHDDGTVYFIDLGGTPDSYDDMEESFENATSAGGSDLITFSYAPQLDEDGYYWFMLDDRGYSNASAVYAEVYELSQDGADYIALGETADVYCDWSEGWFCDMFDGYWLSLPDGQNLSLYIADITEDHILYYSPVFLNGGEGYLVFSQYYDGSISIEGVFDESNTSSFRLLKRGDVLTPIYFSYAVDGSDSGDEYYVGWEYRVTGTMNIRYAPMESGDYYYAFNIEDIYGGVYTTERVCFTVEADGSVYFYTE